jgi:hypothetical protein
MMVFPFNFSPFSKKLSIHIVHIKAIHKVYPSLKLPLFLNF